MEETTHAPLCVISSVVSTFKQCHFNARTFFRRTKQCLKIRYCMGYSQTDRREEREEILLCHVMLRVRSSYLPLGTMHPGLLKDQLNYTRSGSRLLVLKKSSDRITYFIAEINNQISISTMYCCIAQYTEMYSSHMLSF